MSSDRPAGDADGPRSFVPESAGSRVGEKERRGWHGPYLLAGFRILVGLLLGGMMLALIWNVVDTVRLRSTGVRTTGTALDTWTAFHPPNGSDQQGTTAQYTRVRFADQSGATHLATVPGRYEPPAEVPLVYPSGDPDRVRGADETGDTGLALAVLLAVLGAGCTVFVGALLAGLSASDDGH
jgi:hypothetical protein